MKTLPLLIGIVVILVLVWSPALAMSKADALASSKVPGPDDLWVVAPHHIPIGPCDYSDDLFPSNYDPFWFNPLTPGLPWKNDAPSVIPPIPKTTPVPASMGTESLTVKSDPGFALVYFDGQLKGTSPLILTGLSPGSHQLRLTKFGYSDYNTNVTIYAGGTCRGNIRPYDGCRNWLDTIILKKAIN
jgi:hypothetical protein